LAVRGDVARGAVAEGLSIRGEVPIRSRPRRALWGIVVHTERLELGNVQLVGGAPDGNATDSGIATLASNGAVESQLAPFVAAVVPGVIHAACSRRDGSSVRGHAVPVVVDAGGTASTDPAAAAIASTSVDDSGVHPGSSKQQVYRAAIGRRASRTASFRREVGAVDNAAGLVVGERSLTQPATGGLDAGYWVVRNTRTAVRVHIAANYCGYIAFGISLGCVPAADTGVGVLAVIAHTVRVRGTLVPSHITIQSALIGPI